MTDPSTADQTDSEAPSELVLVRWWVAAVAGVGGLVVGVLVAAVLLAATPQFGTGPDGPASGAPGDPQPTGRSTVPVTAEARVNAACLRVINEAQDVVRVLSGADEAVTDVDLQRLDDIVRRLQPIDTRLRRDLRDCRVDTSVAGGSAGSPDSPIPTLSQPSSTPR